MTKRLKLNLKRSKKPTKSRPMHKNAAWRLSTVTPFEQGGMGGGGFGGGGFGATLIFSRYLWRRFRRYLRWWLRSSTQRVVRICATTWS
ncbi:hypothetical protein KIF59_12400 [Enterobacter cloacae subsp. cloacae]|nr:hypothetical protein [Enterobacter cloacae subsp. cloacae]